jgi:membrane associated rhomboid family serine protease
MATFVFAVVLIACAALYFMSADERKRAAGLAVAKVKEAVQAARHASSPDDPFDEMLRARTGRLVVTPLLVALNAIIFVGMLFGSGAFNDIQTLVAWGGNFAPRTTNGEWWRLAGSMFVHGGLFHFLTAMAALVSLGLILERAVGRIAFATIYLASGLLASVVSLWTTSPTSVSFGSSGAVFGIYGLLVASVVWAMVSRPAAGVPLITVKRLAAAAVPFLLYNLVSESLGTTSEMAGFGAGFVSGLLVARGVGREKPAVIRAAWVMAAASAIVVMSALPLRGIIDFRPEIAGIAAVEERTASAYDDALANYHVGRIRAKELIQVIDRTILPDLQTVHARVAALRGVPHEQVPLATAAREYFQLREASWRRRAEGLGKSNTSILRDAEQTERAAMDAFRKLMPTS